MNSTFYVPGLILTEHEFSVPLDHAKPGGDRTTVFAREVAEPDGRDKPFLVFLQGGPGMEAPRPTGSEAPSWLARALQDFRVLMLDQRGTGRSAPVGALPGLRPQQQAEYVTHFRADAIVQDCEWIRRELGVDRWSVLGQSFGGFCLMHYLSVAPDSLGEAFFTGGLAPIGRHPDDVYRATYVRVLERNRRYYEQFPGDRQAVLDIHRQLDESDVSLPSGDRLTSRRFRQLGSMLGASDGAPRLHSIVELPIDSPGFLHDVEANTSFARNPLYAVIHESSYADGHATRWSAQRVMPDEFQAFELFTGEHVYSWMLDDYRALTPLKGAAEILSQHEWPRLYDAEVLARNTVPAAAAIYFEDMYVVRAFSEQTAATIKGLRPWITNEYEHNGLRADGGKILGRLIDLARGRV